MQLPQVAVVFPPDIERDCQLVLLPQSQVNAFPPTHVPGPLKSLFPLLFFFAITMTSL
ncbi:hypothetical protein [Actinomadura hibisca]|uniref:hypothetical protein n=1 Tax=Actinomadura hibisca TaxID=68565 RepID=UPI0012F875FD|nr:hypothetical protein [Actinomadura hibisca]